MIMSVYEAPGNEAATASRTPGAQHAVCISATHSPTCRSSGVSERGVHRALVSFLRQAAATLLLGKRCRQPGNTVPEEIAGAMVVLACDNYAGFNHSVLTDLLAESGPFN